MFDKKDVGDQAMEPRQPTSTGITLQDQPRFSQLARKGCFVVLVHLLPNIKFSYKGTVSSMRCTRLAMGAEKCRPSERSAKIGQSLAPFSNLDCFVLFTVAS